MAIVARSNPLRPYFSGLTVSRAALLFWRLPTHNVAGKSTMAMQSVAAVKERTVLMMADNRCGTVLRGPSSRPGLKKLIPFIKSRSPSA
jgi:hypothetical protein